MLEIADLTCGYGPVHATEGVSFAAPGSAITALLGPNGAGKTSTLMAVAGHVSVLAGEIRFAGESLAGMSPMARTRLGIGLAPEGRRLFPDLTVAENLVVGGYTRSRAAAREGEARVMTLFPRLAERRRQRAGTLSGGEQQMLAIGRALMTEPSLLLVDELSLGLMPAMVDLCFDALLSLKAAGMATLVVEQNTAKALAHADGVVVLSAGRVVHRGSAAAARQDPRLFETYLG